MHSKISTKSFLGPGGYIQWLETEASLFRQFPVTDEFTKAITMINAERRNRDLVTKCVSSCDNKDFRLRSLSMPHFMLRELLAQQSQSPANTSEHQDDLISILSFSLMPGGICRDPQLRNDPINRHLSGTVLESVRLLLAASLDQNRKDGADEKIMRLSDEDKVSIHMLMDAIASSRQSNDVIAGGTFPHLIARKRPT
jgi:hypothetical protein